MHPDGSVQNYTRKYTFIHIWKFIFFMEYYPYLNLFGMTFSSENSCVFKHVETQSKPMKNLSSNVLIVIKAYTAW